MNCPNWMIHQSVRYCLGRRSYAVSDCTDWLIKNWQEIPENTRAIIKQDVEAQFEMEQRGYEYYALGDDMDRRQWLAVAELWRG